MKLPRYVVPDACVLGAAFFAERYTQNAVPLLNAIRTGAVDAIMPTVGMNEFLNICRNKLDKGIAPAMVEQIVEDFAGLPIEWWDQGVKASKEAWRLYREKGIGTNDAFYCLLARDWQAELWTQDGDFISRAAAIDARIGDLRARAFS